MNKIVLLCCAVGSIGVLLNPAFHGLLLKLKLTDSCPKWHLLKFGLYGAALGAISAVIVNGTLLELMLNIVNGATFTVIGRALMLASRQMMFNQVAWQKAGKVVDPITQRTYARHRKEAAKKKKDYADSSID